MLIFGEGIYFEHRRQLDQPKGHQNVTKKTLSFNGRFLRTIPIPKVDKITNEKGRAKSTDLLHNKKWKNTKLVGGFNQLKTY